MKVLSLLMLLMLSLAPSVSAWQETQEDPLYSITSSVKNLGVNEVILDSYFRDGKGEFFHETVVGKEGSAVYESHLFADVRILHSLQEDSPVLEPGVRVMFHGEDMVSAFGWYGAQDKPMFEIFYGPRVDNLLENNGEGDYHLLDRAGLKMIESDGIVATIEDRLGLPLAKRMGVTVDIKIHHRGKEAAKKVKHLRCIETVVQLGPDEQEKRYTFFGNEYGPNMKIFEWTVNNKTKLSWIDGSAGLGFFMFQDLDSDGVFETLELQVKDGDQLVELFDVSDPWNIQLVSKDSELFKAAEKSYARADKIMKGAGDLRPSNLEYE